MHLLFNTPALPQRLIDNLQAYSWSFAHFFLWRPARVLFDCGESAGMRLDSRVFQAETIALTHTHFDHYQGLRGLLEVRAGIAGGKDKPLRIVYPQSDTMESCLRSAREFCARRRQEHVTFEPLTDGQSVALSGKHRLVAHQVEHIAGQLCLSFCVESPGTRLRPEFAHLNKQEVGQLVREGRREELIEPFTRCEFAYSGDTRMLDPATCPDVDVLLHEATFLRVEDRLEEGAAWHATVAEALECAQQARARQLILFHVSRRYNPQELTDGIQSLLDERNLTIPVLVIRGGFNLPTD